VLPTIPISTVQEPWTAFRHFISQLEIINSLSSSNDSFVRTAAQRLAGFDAGRVLPSRAAAEDIEYEIRGSTGWNVNLVDHDESPARHFVGFLAAGYFHPHMAPAQLKFNESPGRNDIGASVQDILSGAIAIDLGTSLRRGAFGRVELIAEIERRAGDPSYAGGPQAAKDVPNSPLCFLPLTGC
jgi:hypothetical protein